MVDAVPAPAPPHAKRTGNPSWTPGCASPNPKGRPPGIQDRRTRLTQALAEDGAKIARVVVDAALEGDMQAAGIVLARIAPVLRSQAQTVTFDFDASAPVARQVEQVLEAISVGAVPPDTGRQIIDAIGTLSAVRMTEELEARLVALEAKEERR